MKECVCRRLPLMLLVLSGCERRYEGSEPCLVHTNRSEAFSVCIPPGWTFQDTTYSFMGRIGVFGLARNRLATGITPYLSRQDWSSRQHAALKSGASNVVEEWVETEQLPTGGVVVMFWHFEGGPVPSCSFSRDSIGDSLTPLVDSLQVAARGADLQHLSFQKWGDDWQIDIFAHDGAAERRSVNSLLRSMVFERIPVDSESKAAQVAYDALPHSVRGGLSTEGHLALDVTVTNNDSVFAVLFERCSTCETQADSEVRETRERWSYRVHRNGTVELLE